MWDVFSMSKHTKTNLTGIRSTVIDQAEKWIISTPPLLFLLIFLLLPALIMLLASLRFPGELGGLAPLFPRSFSEPKSPTGLTLDSYQFFFSDTIFIEILLRSITVALLTTICCIILAYPLALLIARAPQHQRDFMLLLIILPFISNFLVRIYAWIILLGPLDLLYSPTAVFIGMVYIHLPFMVLPLYANLEQHDPLLLDAASDLGATTWQKFWHITFPMSLPGIFSGSVLVFIPAVGSFAISELLGGTGDIMIGNLIKEQFLESRDWPLGSSLALILSLAVLLMAGIVSRYTSRLRWNNA
jgi:spermidine/putrescine transport system permease protein